MDALSEVNHGLGDFPPIEGDLSEFQPSKGDLIIVALMNHERSACIGADLAVATPAASTAPSLRAGCKASTKDV